MRASIDLPANSGSAFVTAVHWVEAALTGSIATAVATVAVASLGYLAFMGRMDFRRAAQVVLGCFILFGASLIAAGLQGIASQFSDGTSAPEPSEIATSPVKLPEQNRPAIRPAHDPYAGATSIMVEKQ